MDADPPELAKCMLLKGLSQRDRETILAGATLRYVRANTHIMEQGAPSNRFFLLRNGYARYFYTTQNGKTLLLGLVGPGEVFGIHAIALAPLHYIVSSEAVRDSEVLVWSRQTFRRYVTNIPHLLDNALLIASTFVDWFLAAYTSVSCQSADGRLAQVLLEYGRTMGERSTGGLLIDVTNGELANAADMTEYTASRLVSKWQRNHWLRKTRGKILLIAPERLLSQSSMH